MGRRRRVGRRLTAELFVIAIALALTAVSCTSSEAPAGGGATASPISSSGSSSINTAQDVVRWLTRIDPGKGKVSVQAIWVTPEYIKAKAESAGAGRYALDKNLVFLLGMDTHSGSLEEYDPTKLLSLRDEAGNEYAPADWENLSDDSHHRSGILRFARLNADGKPIIGPDTRFFELIARNIGGIEERVLRWNVADMLARGQIALRVD